MNSEYVLQVYGNEIDFPIIIKACNCSLLLYAGIARWLDIIPGHHNLQHLQKTVLLGSTRILRKVMSSF